MLVHVAGHLTSRATEQVCLVKNGFRRPELAAWESMSCFSHAKHSRHADGGLAFKNLVRSDQYRPISIIATDTVGLGEACTEHGFLLRQVRPAPEAADFFHLAARTLRGEVQLRNGKPPVGALPENNSSWHSAFYRVSVCIDERYLGIFWAKNDHYEDHTRHAAYIDEK